MQDPVNIDGSVLEGGGQILRIALSLSALCGIPVCIRNIRTGRSKPGLMAQHSKGVELVREISKGSVQNCEIGSTQIGFWPNRIQGGSYNADTKTAGSVALLLQVALPCALFANSDIKLWLRGGTNAEMAPQIDYMTEVFRPVLEKFGASFYFELKRRGYYPKGGGEVFVFVKPVQSLSPVQMVNQGEVKSIYGWCFVAGALPLAVAHEMADAAARHIRSQLRVNLHIERYKEDPKIAEGSCSGIVLVAETTTGCILGGSGLGKRNVRAEQTGTEAAEELVSAIKEGACVDQHIQDQIIILMALASGTSRVRVGKVTLHTETAIFVTEQMTKVKFELIKEGQTTIIQCQGIGLKNSDVKYL